MEYLGINRFLNGKSWGRFTPYLIISCFFHLCIFASILSFREYKVSQTFFSTIEVELLSSIKGVGDIGGGGGGGGGRMNSQLKLKSEELKINTKKGVTTKSLNESKEAITPLAPKIEEEKKVASIKEPSDVLRGLENKVESRDVGSEGVANNGVNTGVGGGIGSGIGSGVGSGIGSGIGSGVGSGIGSGVGSGRGSGQGKGGGLRDELREFQKKIKERIEKVKSYPFLARKNQYEGATYCTFTLLRGGEVKDIRVVGKSGYPVLDEAAKKAIREAAPYPPFPSCIEHSSIEVKVPIVFKLKDFEG
jgi:TonB family protein